MRKIGFIGLGRMGRPMAANLCEKGFELVVLDINEQAVNALVSCGATAGASVGQIARDCSVIVTMLPTAVEVEQVACGPDGIFAHASKGSILLDMMRWELPSITAALSAPADAPSSSTTTSR